MVMFVFFCTQRTAYERRISDWSSDVCSSDLIDLHHAVHRHAAPVEPLRERRGRHLEVQHRDPLVRRERDDGALPQELLPGEQRVREVREHGRLARLALSRQPQRPVPRSEEHTSELQSLMRISYAVFCLKKKKHNNKPNYLP